MLRPEDVDFEAIGSYLDKCWESNRWMGCFRLVNYRGDPAKLIHVWCELINLWQRKSGEEIDPEAIPVFKDLFEDQWCDRIAEVLRRSI